MKKTIASTIVCIATLIPNCYQGACLAQEASQKSVAPSVSKFLGGSPKTDKTRQKPTNRSTIRLVSANESIELVGPSVSGSPLRPLPTQPRTQQKQQSQTIVGSPFKPLISGQTQAPKPSPFQPMVAPKRQSVSAPATAPRQKQTFNPVPIIRPISTRSSVAPKGFAKPSPLVTKPKAQPGSRKPLASSPLVSGPVTLPKRSATTAVQPAVKPATKPQAKKLAVKKSSTTTKKASPKAVALPVPTPPKVAGNSLPKQITDSGWKEIQPQKSTATKTVKKAETKQKVVQTSSTSPVKVSATKPAAVKQQPVRKTSPKKVVQSRTEPVDQGIRVKEISNEQIMGMLLNPTEDRTDSMKSVVGSSILPVSSKKTKKYELSNPKQVLHGEAEHFGDIQPTPGKVYDNGLNLDYSRPSCINELKYDGCGTVSGATGYVFVDALLMDRNDGSFSASALPSNGGFSSQWGGRVTLGRRYDSIEGWEMSFTAVDAWSRRSISNSPGGGLFARLTPTGGFTPLTIAGFNNGLAHANAQKGHYTSFEFNRMSWNWDVLSSFIGIRYNGVDDQYALDGVSALATNAYRIRARNNMIGLQVGGEFFYDIGRRLSFSAKGKLAGYLNLTQTDTELFRNGGQILDNKDEDANFAWGGDLGFYTRFNITPRAKLKFGYEFWYLAEMASVEGQYNGFISPFSGLDLDDDDEVFNHGAVFGLEWYR